MEAFFEDCKVIITNTSSNCILIIDSRSGILEHRIESVHSDNMVCIDFYTNEYF